MKYEKMSFLFPIGIPCRKINSTAGPCIDVRTGQNYSEGSEVRGGSVQPTLAGTGEGTVRLGKESFHVLLSCCQWDFQWEIPS